MRRRAPPLLVEMEREQSLAAAFWWFQFSKIRFGSNSQVGCASGKCLDVVKCVSAVGVLCARAPRSAFAVLRGRNENERLAFRK